MDADTLALAGRTQHEQPLQLEHEQGQRSRGGSSKQLDDDEALFFVHLRSGASKAMLEQSGDDQSQSHKAHSRSGGSRKAKEEEAEDEDEREEDRSQADSNVGKAKEAASAMPRKAEKDSISKEERERAEQMRRDEEMARQLQIQFLREEADGDEELMRQLNMLVQAENDRSQNDVSIILEDDDNTVECAICCDEKPLKQIYTYYQCNHRYCTDCLKEYYATHIKEGNVKLRCPYPNCPTLVLPVQIAAVADPELMKKYKQFSWFDEVKNNPNSRWCTRPGCETVITRVSEDDQKVVCSGCHTALCFLCGDEWHADKSCQNNREEKIKMGLVDTSVEEYTKTSMNVRICPRCAVPIEKNKGCNTMTCSFCSCQFCWLCGEFMTPGHFSKKGPCKGKDGESKVLKATVYTIIATMIITFPLWIGPAYTVYKIKQHKKKRRARRETLTTGSGVSTSAGT